MPVIASAFVLALSGCWRPHSPTVQQLDRGLIWMFPGVEGGPWQLRDAHRAFRDAGIDAAIEIHDWSRPFGILANLTAYERNRADAKRIAASIAEYARTHETRPVDLVGYSGGGGLAVFVAEAMPEPVRVRNIVLVQPALSPDYDLCPSLRRIDGRIIHLHSPLDSITLGSGTSLFGTMDRKYTNAAGKDGFVVERAVADESLQPRLVQVAWNEAAAAAGHDGRHMAMLGYEWNRRFVAPWIAPPSATTSPATETRR